MPDIDDIWDDEEDLEQYRDFITDIDGEPVCRMCGVNFANEDSAYCDEC